MRIAIIYATFYTRGGAENVLLWLTEALLERGHQVTIFTSEYDKHDQDISETIRNCIVEVDAAGGNYSTCLDWMLTGRRLRKRLQDFDVVNPHNFPANVWVYFAKRFSPSFPPIIWYCQEPSRLLHEQETQKPQGNYPSLRTHVITKFRQEQWKALLKLFQKSLFYSVNFFFGKSLKKLHRILDANAVQSCDLILANSTYTASKIQNIYKLHAQICYQGIPLARDAGATSYSKKQYFLTVTRLERLKHVDSIIRAVHILVNQRYVSEISLIVIGKGSEETSLKNLVTQLHLTDHILFPGYIANGDLQRYYGEALAVIYVPEDEPFGLVPLEAMLYRTAVIVSNEGGILETVVDRVTGIRVSPKNSRQIADAMELLLNDKTLASTMGERGYQHVLERFTFSHYVDRFEHSMRQVCESV